MAAQFGNGGNRSRCGTWWRAVRVGAGEQCVNAPGARTGFRGHDSEPEGNEELERVVVQALAWTQKEPGNAAAWNELSIGYTNTRQRDDAHAAARRAVDLAPKNALYWRKLGDLNLDRDAPVEALLAFEEATSWNTQDGYSFVQTGILNTRLDRLPEAKVAFTKALALNPNDMNARCGAAMIARRLTPSQPNASAKSAAPGAATVPVAT